MKLLRDRRLPARLVVVASLALVSCGGGGEMAGVDSGGTGSFAVVVFGIPLRGSLWLLYGGAVFYLAAVVGLGLFISALSTTQQQAILGAFLFMVPATLLSGFATPIENMPTWLQPITLANPLRHFLVIVRGVFLKDLPAAEIAANTLPLALIASVTLGAAAWLFRRRLQ